MNIAHHAQNFSQNAEETPGALVVFAGETTLWRLRFLRPKFRHCFVAIHHNQHWVICDPLSHRTDLLIIGEYSAAYLAQWYRNHGLTVVETQVRAAPLRLAPLGPFTCVEAVKRVLGIHARWVITPWQLYRFLAGTN